MIYNNIDDNNISVYLYRFFIFQFYNRFDATKSCTDFNQTVLMPITLKKLMYKI